MGGLMFRTNERRKRVGWIASKHMLTSTVPNYII